MSLREPSSSTRTTSWQKPDCILPPNWPVTRSVTVWFQIRRLAMAKAKKNVDRRKFLRGAAGLIATTPAAFAQRAAEKPEATGGAVDVTSNVRCGADFMVDVFKSLGIEYLAANPGTSFRGLHESVINYGNNKDPEFLTCLH